MLKFNSPYFLFLIPLILMLFFLKRKNKGIRVPSLHFYKQKKLKTSKEQIEKFFNLLGFIMLVIALSRPQLLENQVKDKKKSVDIVITLDLSQSMEARDFSPSRLEKSKLILKNFINERNNDRISLVVFAGDSYTKVPLTFDHKALETVLMGLTTDDILSNDRTAIGMGLGVSVNRLKNSVAKSKVIILLTDGENNSGEMSPHGAAAIAKELGIKVYTIGVGAKEREVGTFFGTVKIENDEIDEKLLEYISQETGGKYFRASDDKSFREIFKEIDQLEKTEIDSKNIQDKKEIFIIFLKIALIAFLIGLFFKYVKYIKIP